MKQKIYNYTVLINKEKRLGTQDECYTLLVPILGVATESDTLDDVQKDARSLIRFHLEALASEDGEIPVESRDSFVTKLELAV